MIWLAIIVAMGGAFMLGGAGGIWAAYKHPPGHYPLSELTAMKRWAFLIMLLGLTGIVWNCHASTVQVPDVDARLRLMVEQAVADEWGVDGSPARLAAQMHQESGWNAHAASGVGAEGLAQIMPATGRWLATMFPQLGPYDPWDPAWSARAAAAYDHWLLLRNPGATTCSNWGFAFSAYNGGETYLHREQRLADAHAPGSGAHWFGGTALQRARSHAAWVQNRTYVHRILLVLEPAYIAAGWPGTAACA